MKKIMNYLPSVNLSLRSWFSEAAVHRCFPKQVFLKILQYWSLFLIKLQAFFTEHLRWLFPDICGSKSDEFGTYCWHLHRFLFQTLLKTRFQPQKQPLELFCKKGVLKNFINFIGKHQCWSLFLIELLAFRPAT